MSRLYVSIGNALSLWCLSAMLLGCGGNSPTIPSPGKAESVPDTPVPPAIAQSHAANGGKSALDSFYGSMPGRDNSFILAASSTSSCDGWAFDDERKSTPQEVWIELTQRGTGRHFYWHARRYDRPALAKSEKIPPTASVGFLCDPVRLQLPIGKYSAKVYQVDGQTSIVSDFNTYTPTPEITVK